jgi:opacity protein-like surface antigen
MRRIVVLTFLMLLLAAAASAGETRFGIGVLGGINMPLVQDNQGTGTAFGAKAIIGGLPIFTLEPYFMSASNGDPDLDDVTNDLEGSKITAYGIDAKLGALIGAPGIAPYFFGGIGFYKTSNDQLGAQIDDGTDFGFGGGLGLNISLVPYVAIDVRGKVNVVPTDGGGSDKSLWLTAGLNYYFGAN